MDSAQAFWLGLIQGITEFLPISSSAHLILLPQLLGWPDQGLAFDVAVHVGTLLAVVWHFRRQLLPLASQTLASASRREAVGESGLGWALIIGTMPLVLGALVLADAAETVFRGPQVIAWATIGFGLLLWLAARRGNRGKDEFDIGPWQALFIGSAQVLAIIPGTSRSGITMTAGLWLGLEATAAARFSFLLSIPAIALAGIWKTWQLMSTPAPVDWGVFALGVVVAGASAYTCIRVFLALVARIGMTPFVVYRLALGVALLIVFGPGLAD
ncbi:undecaprenyl pyrophosphate phosphatase [Spiribacter salinus M19-40]|uniref:Undecaprenyl-diphosphatase n=1 Tax=Spiribacter salinus M19-40 TaxID=1260251 RepID=R4VHY8_9GAMM|nr:undecaprenyl-diphosphate phosphatase [Spiribacter salinus]AGM40217.1 undecaprenyl pyrophosphate phosphatase [Spiribacter salinus M19-40]MBY5268552.1 undecaprenyl-diphosphatase [Spiribacter salinus]